MDNYGHMEQFWFPNFNEINIQDHSDKQHFTNKVGPYTAVSVWTTVILQGMGLHSSSEWTKMQWYSQKNLLCEFTGLYMYGLESLLLLCWPTGGVWHKMQAFCMHVKEYCNTSKSDERVNSVHADLLKFFMANQTLYNLQSTQFGQLTEYPQTVLALTMYLFVTIATK